ncbi:SHOCT domain-containing protein [Streptomyces sp. NPDC002004]
MPGLLRGVARTAVVAGTATAVSNRVSRRQAGRWAQQENAQQQYAQPEYAQQAPAAPPQPAPSAPAAVSMEDKIDQLKQLGELKAQGVLSEAEFEEQKGRILAS